VPTPEGLPPGHPPISGADGAPRPGPTVSGTITLAPAVAGRRAASDVLYVIARQRESKVVVAVLREENPRFPHAFEISAADAMTQGQAFTGPFDITARLSKTGDAIPSPGDLEGTASTIAEGARGVAVQIDTVRH
jgi:cytochrome c-type biogenesis protein CcmH